MGAQYHTISYQPNPDSDLFSGMGYVIHKISRTISMGSIAPNIPRVDVPIDVKGRLLTNHNISHESPALVQQTSYKNYVVE